MCVVPRDKRRGLPSPQQRSHWWRRSLLAALADPAGYPPGPAVCRHLHARCQFCRALLGVPPPARQHIDRCHGVIEHKALSCGKKMCVWVCKYGAFQYKHCNRLIVSGIITFSLNEPHSPALASLSCTHTHTHKNTQPSHLHPLLSSHPTPCTPQLSLPSCYIL